MRRKQGDEGERREQGREKNGKMGEGRDSKERGEVSNKKQRRVNGKTYDVDNIDVLPPLVLLPLDPVPVKVGEETVDVSRSGGVPIPLLGVVTEERLIGEIFGLGADLFEVGNKVRREVLVEVCSHKVGAAYRGEKSRGEYCLCDGER